jgi:hypothetical protein
MSDKGRTYRGTDKNGAKISVFGSKKKVNVTGSIGILPNVTNFSCRQQGHRKERVLPWERGQSCPHGAGTAPPPYCPGSADVLVGKKYGAVGQGRRGRRRSQEISLSPATR